MGRLGWFFAIVAVLWCLWWGIASAVMRSSIEAWLSAREVEGWQAEATLSGGGFPQTLVTQLDDVALADPNSGLAVRAAFLRLEADAWWPGQARLVLPQDQIRFATPEARADLLMDGGLMTLDLAPSQALTLKRLSWTSGPWGVAQPDGSLISADTLTLAMVQQSKPATYHFDINVDSAAPGEILRAGLRIPAHWPIAFDSLRMDMQVTFDQPWDLRALEQRRPQPRQIDLKLAEAHWGDVQLNLAAELSMNDDGIASGEISVQAKNWKAMLDLAETAQILPPALRQQSESVLASLARATGNSDTIDVRLTARNGLIYLGFVPLGPAPRLVLR